MKKLLHTTAAFLFIVTILFSLQGCLKDTCRNTYKIYTPIYKSLAQVRAAMISGAPQPLKNIGKLNVYGNYIFLNEAGKGIHIIDNATPSSPKNIGFITIPGNVDLAVKGSYLYADSYSDLVTFDISSPAAARPVNFVNNLMRDRNIYWRTGTTNPDSVKVLVDYVARDTTVDCAVYRGWNRCANCMNFSQGSGSVFMTAAPQTGIGGSMARFAIVQDYLYAVSSTELYSITISAPAAPQQTASKIIGGGIETIYPFQNKLFIGSTTGMVIYDLTTPANPTAQGTFTHAKRCDPVIADGQYAYVTLRSSNSTCGGTSDELNVVDVSNLSTPVLKKSYSLTNPFGLSKDGNTLFVCDGKAGLKMYDAANPSAIQLLNQFTGLETYDVIAFNGKAIVVAKDGLYQFAYSNTGSTLVQLSKLSISK
ncbi:MAG: hypothetical protein M3Y85_02955 [Bacteroidota bacterium]|nr:hypothetical protein [Bacteroidota bacterium]